MENKTAKKIALTLVVSSFLSVAFMFSHVNANTRSQSAFLNEDGIAPQLSASPLNLVVTIFPNPANEEVNLVFTLPETDHLTFSVTDVIGKTTKLKYSGTFYQGENSIKLETSNLATGTYIVTVSGVKVKGNVKLILTH